MNGDGYDDLIIGADRADPNGDSSGETYVVYGGASAPGTDGVLDLSPSALDGSNGFTLTGIDADDRSGRSVSSAGDVNGDGYDDLIIGAWGTDRETGETHVVYGGIRAPGTAGVLALSMLDGSNGFTLSGIDVNDFSGFAVSSAGDVNGDGYDDLVIGAWNAVSNGRRSGETYVVYGGVNSPGTAGVLDLSMLNGANGFTLIGIDAGDRSGRSVSSAGDVNGDGYDDLIIGASSADPNGGGSGETYVVYGGASAPGTDGVLNLSPSVLDGANGFILAGTDAGDFSGTSVSSAGDVNGDGYDDLIIGASSADPNGSGSGETYVVYGGASAPGTDGVLDLSPSSLDGANGFILKGSDAGDYSGRSVSSAGDVNGDGYDDLIIGARGADPNGQNSGETYVIYGGATGTESTEPITAQGTAAADNFTGNGGADSFTGIAAGDVVRGGPGDDSISVTSLDFADIDGGTGRDILALDGSDLALDLRGAGNGGVDSVEVFDLSGTGANRLVLDALAVFDLTEERAGGMAALDVLGDADDTVRLIQPADQPFTLVGQEAEDGVTYNVYRAGNAEVRVETAVQIHIPATTIDLSLLDGSSGFVLTGIDGEDQSGFSVSSAGDVNGDGYDDLIIGAGQADPGGTYSGETYVVYGGATGTDLTLNLSALDGSNGFTLTGIDANDRSGSSVSSAGDVNGDGYDDLIIGAYRADGHAGETYVVYGGASAPGTAGVLALSALDGSNGFTLNGIEAFDLAGSSVSSAGDVNGDGYDDLIIGARWADSLTGETYVIYGGARAPGTEGVLALSALNGLNGFILTGIDANDFSGISVSSAGDVNGDGYDDLIIGAYRADPNGEGSGETYVVYGGARAPGTGGVLALSALNGSNGFTLNGIDANDYSGWSVSSAGDVNGDGYDDLIIGANRADPNGDSSGETYVVYGGATGTDLVLNRSTLNGSNGFTLSGIDANDQSGVSVSSAGDVNGDGYADLIIGAHRADSDTGESYVVYGGARAPGTNGVLELSRLDGTNGLILDGVDASDYSGRSVSSAGDVNGDGYDDLIIGARGGGRTDPDGGLLDQVGETYVVYGGATETQSTVPVTAQGTAAADNFTGNAGADSFTGIATDDVVRGGAGDDSISVTSLDFADIDGGAGQDSLVLDGSDLALDLRGAGNGGVDSVEVFDLSGAGPNRLVLDALAVFDLTEERAGGIATLDVLGDGDDTVWLTWSADQSFAFVAQETEDGTTYNVYRNGNAEVRVETGVQIQIPAASIDLSLLDGSNGFILTGIDVEDRSGFSVSSAGDVNGDGYDDLIIGAGLADPDGTHSGETYVVYGGATGTDLPMTLSALDGSNGFTLTGIDANDRSGSSVSSAGDVNGDGYDDLIIGAYRADPNGEGSGETYVVYGGASAPGTAGVLALSALDGSNGFTLNGIDAFDLAGSSVSSAGDVNGDGYDDLIIGARWADNLTGETYVVYGGASAPGTEGVLDLSALNGDNGFILTGIDANDFSGISVSSAGDVNGDGYDDLIIGAYRADPNGEGSGETYVLYGAASAPGKRGMLDLSVLNGVNDFTLSGSDANDRSGISVSSAGDVNGDGYDDLIVGAYQADPNGESSGETYVVYGGATGMNLVLNRSTLNGSNGFILNGIDANDQSGVSVSSAGDVNGDGYDDLIIGASRADSDVGETYVVYGGASAPGTNGVLELSRLDGTNGLILNGVDAGDYSGRSVSSAGDVNGDGYNDLIIGAWGGGRTDSDGGLLNEVGETYVVYGRATETQSTMPITAEGTAAADNFTGNAGADSFTGIAAGDVVRGGAGDDSISVTSLDFADIDGGTGRDALVLAGSNLALDLRGAGNGGVDSVEVFDLSGAGANRLVLDALAVFDLTEERAGGIATLDVLGNADDTVDLRDGNFTFHSTETEDNTTYTVYRDGNAEVRVQTGVQVQIIVAPVFTSDATASVAENQTAAYTAVATDADNDMLSYSLSGTDAALFTINPTTGVVSFIAAPDFENPGDAGGDNVYDITVTASDETNQTDHNVAITVTDKYELIDLGTLDGTNGFILNGIDGGDRSGWSVSSAGDVNGDGYDDLIIGARGADPSGNSRAGETYVVYGGASAPGAAGVLALSALDGTNGFTLNGIDANDYSGWSVSSAGDVNGDGYDDLIIGAYRAGEGGNSFAGETYVVYGGTLAPGTAGVLALSALDGANGFMLTGIDAGDISGRSVSSAGDVNGDGYDDLIIGAPAADPGGDLESGETYVVYGGAPGTDGVPALSALNGTNGFMLTGIDANDRSGSSVSSAGDVNGDGYDDLIIGTYRADPNGEGSGETYVVYGGATGMDLVLNRSTLDGANGFMLTGIDANDNSGISVASAGDVNGDGYDDLIIGASKADRTDPDGTSLDNVGETYVVYGGASAPGTGGVLALSALDGANGFVLTGIDADDYSGLSVSSAGDVNGDGYGDLIIGANQADPNRNNSGETYVVYGGATGTARTLDLSTLDGANGFTLTGIDRDDSSGRSVSSAGDVNGDGYDDLIIGAYRADPNGLDSGETYVVYGGATGTESTAPITAQGTAAADNFTGNAGTDSFTGIATGDVVRGGAGDDSIGVTSLDFADIDGGTGRDTLVLEGSNLSLDLRGAGNGGVDSVEVFDLSGAGANTLVLDALAVFDLTEERAGGIAILDVLGDASDTVELRDSNFTSNGTVTEDGTTYNVYRDGNAEVRVQDGVTVTPGTMSSGLLSGDPDPDTVAMPASPAPDLSRLDALVVTGETGLDQLGKDGDLMDSLTEWVDNGPRNEQWHEQWDSLWDGSFQADGLNSLDKPDRHRLDQEPVFEDLSVWDQIPDLRDTGEDAVPIPLSVPAVAAMPQVVLESDTPLHNDLALILQDMEIFADPVKNGDTDMDSF